MRQLRRENPVMDFSSTLIRRHLLEVFSNCFKCYYNITVNYYYSYLIVLAAITLVVVNLKMFWIQT
jgi:hypothetical protein